MLFFRGGLRPLVLDFRGLNLLKHPTIFANDTENDKLIDYIISNGNY